MLQQPRTDRLIGIPGSATQCVIALLLLVTVTPVALTQPVQTIDSERELASRLCRNPTEAATNELLTTKNAQLVNATLWNELLNCAFSAQRQQSRARAIEIYKLTLRVAERLNERDLLATTYYHLGRTYWRMNDLESSIQAYETTRKLIEQGETKRSLVHILADLAALYFTTEDFEKARSYADQSLAITEEIKLTSTELSPVPIEYGQARSLHTLAEIDRRYGNYEEANKKLNKALALYEQLKGAEPPSNVQMAEVFIALAKVHGEMGKYARAFSFLTKAHQISRGAGDQNTRADIMSNRAWLFLEQEDYAAAQKYFNVSLGIYKSLGNVREEARVLLSMAIIEERKRRYDDAQHLLQQSMERARTTNLVDVQIAATDGLGVVLTAKREFQNALNVINEGIELARRVNAKPREAEMLWRASQTYYAMHNYREAASLAEQSLTLARSLRLPKLSYFATAALGEAYAADGRFESAIITLKDAIQQIDELRDEVAGRQESRQLFFENKVAPYHTLVKILTGQGKNFEALRYAERAKGRLLLEAVRNNRSDLQDIYTKSEKAEAELLIEQLSAIRERIKWESDQTTKTELQYKLEAVQRELTSFQERLAVAHPELPLRAGPAQHLTHASLNNLVRTNDVAYLEYVVTHESIGLFVLKGNGTASEHQLKYISLPVPAGELRGKVNEFHSALAERHPGYHRLGRELYQLLIAPAANELQGISRIWIIPDEFLWTLPFQALTNTQGDYLIQDYSLLYAPSLSVLNEMTLRRRQQNSNESLLAFGNPLVAQNGKLNEVLHPLPEAEREVAAIAASVRTRMQKVFIGNEADEKTFRALAPQYATIHLATHGVLDNRDPLNSYLVLTKTDDDDTENDGLLQAREIINIPLDADLAVLSACQTGNGRVSPGEGVIGMSWAFFVAGARSVVVSQWRVNSASTSLLMEHFYQALARRNDANSRTKSEALREASLRLLKDRRYRHPFYWAGFVLVSSN